MAANDRGQLRGLHRVLAQETNISDLLQYLTDKDPRPWRDFIDFVPTTISREFKLDGPKGRNLKGTADLHLKDQTGHEVLIELKLAHEFSELQRAKYEASTDGTLILAGLAADEALVRGLKRWKYLDLASIVTAWRDSRNRDAAWLASRMTAVIMAWDQIVAAVLEPIDSPSRSTLDTIQHKFIARVVARQIADQLALRGWTSQGTVTSGGGGLAITQAWAPLQRDAHGHLIAEVRWWEDMQGGELRFGVDYWDPDTTESRAEAWALATAMDDTIRIDALWDHLVVKAPALARLLQKRDSGRQQAKGDWQKVVKLGFKSRDNPHGVTGNRRSTWPTFYGDGPQRYEAKTPLGFDQASACDLIELIHSSLIYLVDRLPPGYRVRR